jgi:transcription antitermination factor NusG
MNESKKWFAVYTRPRWEKKVAESLTKNKIENYCPINKVVRQWSDRKKVVYEPLFTSYVFVKITDKEHLSLRKTDGVINFVYWLNKPAVIPDHEIDTIKSFLSTHSNVTLQKTPINVMDKVRVLSGPLFEQEGQVLFVKNRTIKIALPSMGYLMYAEVETSNVEVVPETTTIMPQHVIPPYQLPAAK